MSYFLMTKSHAIWLACLQSVASTKVQGVFFSEISFFRVFSVIW